MNFVSAGLRKSAAEEKEQKEESSDDSDDDGVPSAPPASRGIAPKKLQMVNNVFLWICYVVLFNCVPL